MASDIRLSFDSVPELYDSVRPRYPSELFDKVLKLFTSPPTVIEVGPGTGQASKQLIKKVDHLTMVEIGSNLAKKLETNLSGYNNYEIVVADIEQLESSNRFDLFSLHAPTTG